MASSSPLFDLSKKLKSYILQFLYIEDIYQTTPVSCSFAFLRTYLTHDTFRSGQKMSIVSKKISKHVLRHSSYLRVSDSQVPIQTLPKDLLFKVQEFVGVQRLSVVCSEYSKVFDQRKSAIFNHLQRILNTKAIHGEHLTLFLYIFLARFNTLDELKKKLIFEMRRLKLTKTDLYKKLYLVGTSPNEILQADILIEQENFNRAKETINAAFRRANILLELETHHSFNLWEKALPLLGNDLLQPIITLDFCSQGLVRLPHAIFKLPNLRKIEINLKDHVGDVSFSTFKSVKRTMESEKSPFFYCDWHHLFQFAHDGQTELIQAIYARTNLFVNTRTSFDQTLLTIAAGEGNLSIVKFLLTLDETDVNIQVRPETRLPFGIFGHTKIPYHLQISGRTALMLAILKGHVEVAKAIISDPRTDVNLRDDQGFTALMLAYFLNDKTTTNLLLSHRNIITHLKNKDGFTAKELFPREPYELSAPSLGILLHEMLET